jgi:hypothetical protein
MSMLLTVRVKDIDVTADELRAIAAACTKAARGMSKRTRTKP